MKLKRINLVLICIFGIISILSFNPFLLLITPIVTEEKEGKITDEQLKEIYSELDLHILKYPESDFLFKLAKRRMRKKLGVIFLITGGTGRGKSYYCLRFLERWYKERFKESVPLKHVCNSIEEAVILAKSFKRKGEGLMIEELSVHAGSRSSMTTQNKMFNAFLDVVRIKQIIILGNCPHKSFVDRHFFMMCQAWVNCTRVDFENNIVLAKAYQIQTSPFSNEPYTHRFINEDGDYVDLCFMKKPSDELCEVYENIKDGSNEDIFDNIVLKLQQDKIDKLKAIGQRFLAPRERQVYELHLKGFTSKDGANELGLKDRQAFTDVLRIAKNKLKTPEYSKEMRKYEKKHKEDVETPKGTPIKYIIKEKIWRKSRG